VLSKILGRDTELLKRLRQRMHDAVTRTARWRDLRPLI
jgi:hypothetical protein